MEVLKHIPVRPTIARMYVKDKWLSRTFDTAGELSPYLCEAVALWIRQQYHIP